MDCVFKSLVVILMCFVVDKRFPILKLKGFASGGNLLPSFHPGTTTTGSS